MTPSVWLGKTSVIKNVCIQPRTKPIIVEDVRDAAMCMHHPHHYWTLDLRMCPSWSVFVCALTLILSSVACSASTHGLRQDPVGDCGVSDANLLHLQARVCKSIGNWNGCPSLNVTVNGDWPSQATYYNDLLVALGSSQTCLNTTVGRDVVNWLDVVDPKINLFFWTWLVFQPNYYDMPLPPSAPRIESPATLGRKCWAFAYLDQIWATVYPPLAAAVKHAGLSLEKMFTTYEAAVEKTMPLCFDVMANCFVNASYNPVRNGTCPTKYGQFYVGFQWENGRRNDTVAYAFPSYTQTPQFHSDAMFAINTALNYII